MAIYYIDPDWTGTESGTEAEPYANFSSITEAVNDVYKFKYGTTHTSASTLTGLLEGVTVEAYGDSLLARPILTTTDNATVINIRGVTSGRNQTIRNVDLQLTSAVSTSACLSIVENPVDFTVEYGVTVENCYMSGGKWQVNTAASGLTFTDCTFDDSGEDNVYTEGANNIYDNCNFSNPGRDELGDNIQFSDTQDVGNAHSCIIRNCTLDKSGTASKNNIFMGNGGTGNRIYNNTVFGGSVSSAGISVQSAGDSECYGNTVTGGQYCYFIAAATGPMKLYKNKAIANSFTERCINVFNGDNHEIYSNFIDFTLYAAGAEAGIFVNTADGTGIYNNVVLGSPLAAGIVTDSITNGTSTIKNNIVINAKYGMSKQAGDIETNNCLYDIVSWDIRLAGNTEGTPDVTDVLLDPLHINPSNDDYNLQQSSPCVGAGVKWWGTDPRPDTLGDPLPDNKIDLGAYQSTWDANHPDNL